MEEDDAGWASWVKRMEGMKMGGREEVEGVEVMMSGREEPQGTEGWEGIEMGGRRDIGEGGRDEDQLGEGWEMEGREEIEQEGLARGDGPDRWDPMMSRIDQIREHYESLQQFGIDAGSMSSMNHLEVEDQL